MIVTNKVYSILKSIYNWIRFIIAIPINDYFNRDKISIILKVFPKYTLCGYKRLSNVYKLAMEIEKNKVDGAFVECGVWKGGCSAVMVHIADKFKSNRKSWLFDSFEGMPEATSKDGINKETVKLSNNRFGGKLTRTGNYIANINSVKRFYFQVLKFKKGNINIIKGWFQNTLPKYKNKIGKISILRLDGDWYESTKTCLENLYNNVIKGGYIIIDDYGHFPGCKKAVTEFRNKKRINTAIIKIDYTGVYFKKS